MASTYTPIATTTLAVSAASYTFSSIPSTYTDLILIAAVKGTVGSPTDYTEQLQYNGDTTSGLYSDTILKGDGTTASSNRHSGQNQIYISTLGYLSTTNIRTTIVQIQNYANTSTYKTCLVRDNQADAAVGATVGLWRNTAAISSVTMSLQGGTFGIGSTFTLYGILSA